VCSSDLLHADHISMGANMESLKILDMCIDSFGYADTIRTVD